jgi:hypothetical protein
MFKSLYVWMASYNAMKQVELYSSFRKASRKEYKRNHSRLIMDLMHENNWVYWKQKIVTLNSEDEQEGTRFYSAPHFYKSHKTKHSNGSSVYYSQVDPNKRTIQIKDV